MISTRVRLLLATAFLLVPVTSWAASIDIDDSTTPGKMRIIWEGFDGDVVVNGTARVGATGFADVMEAQIPGDGFMAINFAGNWPAPGLNRTVTSTAYSDEGDRKISDRLTYVVTGDGTSGSIGLVFTSNTENTLGTIPQPLPAGDAIVPEVYSISTFPNLRFDVTSDTSDIPEPSTLLLVATGLVGLVGLLKRKTMVSEPAL